MSMANRDPEPESQREQYSLEYLENRKAGLPFAPAVAVVEAEKESPAPPEAKTEPQTEVKAEPKTEKKP
jgi:hypothetical protein